MTLPDTSGQPMLTFPEAEKSPLSIRAKALVFIDPRSQQLRQTLERLAPLPLPVLVRGETGTGKELLARHIHKASGRAGLFVSVNCGALSPNHAEAELFGYTAGTYASAAGRTGWFGSANGGTLYLDEIGDLPQSLQAKFLAALENHEVTRVGAGHSTPVDVRLVAASSIDLAQAVAAGKFNERLYRYLREGDLELPALRDRPGDILPLAEYFLGVYSQRLGLAVPVFSDQAQARLAEHPWPGNTRELENVVHFALLVSRGDIIGPEHLNVPQPRALPLRQCLEREIDTCGPDGQAALRQLIEEALARLH
ncbi:sigma 54-interacting transcriptional regulator [Pseudomonas typographi]|uniref:Sigma 54-interacting transcriptional regulator n=1 Tax=Pseudomonas typographi TaxID=2715964 RepID=A0ABR7YZ59_9PSED|nr:sigma 54-interacting transcriptional regulator [Pseudomonas typographi]MBD1550019.1 sigma 54-interacting transcriptional regulator [Pseudomonas typographi]MBD1585401.1 sigma 54-interacting transcriptional regulator [Pseudomonas typographi]MBD1598485.1 sigma 54-interacting transcriptional regulator [Pseudomonas typographi]